MFNPSGQTGAELRQAAAERVREWLDYRDGRGRLLMTQPVSASVPLKLSSLSLSHRIRFGFGEYNSETYGKIVYFPVIVLSHLSPDEDIRLAAEGVRQAVCAAEGGTGQAESGRRKGS